MLKVKKHYNLINIIIPCLKLLNLHTHKIITNHYNFLNKHKISNHLIPIHLWLKQSYKSCFTTTSNYQKTLHKSNKIKPTNKSFSLPNNY
jgi:hypothetical protein